MGNAPSGTPCKERETFYGPPDEWTDEDGMRLGELEGIVGDHGGYTAETDAALCSRSGIAEACMSEDVGIADGQKVRVLLAQALLGNAKRAALDEPTNNLDLESVHCCKSICWGLHRLPDRHFPRRHFLNEVCTHTADIDYQSIITYTGAYERWCWRRLKSGRAWKPAMRCVKRRSQFE